MTYLPNFCLKFPRNVYFDFGDIFGHWEDKTRTWSRHQPTKFPIWTKHDLQNLWLQSVMKRNNYGLIESKYNKAMILTENTKSFGAVEGEKGWSMYLWFPGNRFLPSSSSDKVDFGESASFTCAKNEFSHRKLALHRAALRVKLAPHPPQAQPTHEELALHRAALSVKLAPHPPQAQPTHEELSLHRAAPRWRRWCTRAWLPPGSELLRPQPSPSRLVRGQRGSSVVKNAAVWFA